MAAAEYRSEMAKDLLEKAGIKVVVMNQHDTAFQNFGEFELYVPDENEAQAVELLKGLKH